MKNIFFIIVLFGQTLVFAQTKEESVAFTVAEFRGGYGLSMFGTGLKERYKAGNFSSSAGGLASLAAFRKFKKVNYLNLGLKFKSLGAGPAQGDNDQEMFFNYWGAAVAAKYFPFNKNAQKGLYVQADYFFVSQFTQKYRNIATKTFDHQFAIGTGFVLGLGYDFTLGSKKTRLTVGLEYETNSRNGDQTGVGEKNFKSSNIGLMTGFKF